MRTQIISVPVTGTSSSVIISLVGHDHKIARTLDHPLGTGRWIDQYEVKRTADFPYIPEGKVTTPDLDQAVRIGHTFYSDAATRYAEARWGIAVKESKFITLRRTEGS